MSEHSSSALRSKARGALYTFLDLRPGDGLSFTILLIHSFLKGSIRVLFETPVNTLFLSRFSLADLPFIYMTMAVLSTLIGYAYANLEKRMSVRALLISTMGLVALSTLG